MNPPRSDRPARRHPDSPAVCLADALRLRCAALDEMVRQHAGPAMLRDVLLDIRRLAAELKCALDAEQALERIRTASF
jgi:hypothetical protein